MPKKITLFFATLALLAVFVLPAQAAVLDNIPCAGEENCTPCDLVLVVTNIIDLILGYSGVILMVFIIVGGIFMLTSWGNTGRIDVGKKIITAGIIGIVIVFLAWTLVNIVFLAMIGTTGDSFASITGNGGKWNVCNENPVSE